MDSSSFETWYLPQLLTRQYPIVVLQIIHTQFKMSSVEFSSTQVKLKVLTANLVAQSLVIPAHQRDFVWKRSAQQGLVDTVLRGMPMPEITIRKKELADGMFIQTLEDGQQRLTTLRLYMDDAFPDKDGRYFSQLSEIVMERFRNYPVTVKTYEGATDAEAIEIFMKLQDGSALSVGEKIHSIRDKAPIVGFAQELLLTPGMGVYDRTVPFWGVGRSPKSGRGKDTVAAVVICSAISKQSSEFLTKEGLKPHAFAEFADFDRDRIRSTVEKVVGIFERVCERQPTNSAATKKKYWELSNFVAYILHGLLLKQDELPDCELPSHEDQAAVWVDFIVRQGLDPSLLERELHCGDKTSGGHTGKHRWHRGWLRMFPQCAGSSDQKTSSDTSDSSSDEA